MTAATAIATSVPEEEEIEGVEIEQPEGQDEAQAEIEARARLMGWHPFAEFNGPPSKWTDAATFLKKGEEDLPILRDRYRRLEQKFDKQGDIIADLSRTVTEQKQVLEEMRTLARTSDERGYKRALSELEQQQAAAEEAGDIKAFKQVTEQIHELEETRAEVAPKPDTAPPPVPRSEPDPAIVAFARVNKDWWNKDAAMSQYMIGAHNAVIAENPDMPLAEQLDLAVEDVKRRFPNRFNDEDTTTMRQPARRAAPVAAPTARQAPSSRTSNGLDSIADPAERAEAKQAYAKFKRQMPDMTEGEYLTLWNDPRADIIAMRREKKEKQHARA